MYVHVRNEDKGYSQQKKSKCFIKKPNRHYVNTPSHFYFKRLAMITCEQDTSEYLPKSQLLNTGQWSPPLLIPVHLTHTTQ